MSADVFDVLDTVRVYAVVPYWLSAHGVDEHGTMTSRREPVSVISESLITSKAFQKLNLSERFVYVCMVCAAGQEALSGFTFSNPRCEEYGISTATFRRALVTLKARGFVEVLQKQKGKPILYRFSSDWQHKED